MKTNEKGIALIKQFEGLRLESYKDPIGIWTIGYGTTLDVRPGVKITEAEADEYLRRDLTRAEERVSRMVRVPLTENQFSALVAFVYNVGAGNFQYSTLLKRLNNKDYSGAAEQFSRWVMAGGRILPGLQNRRQAEKELFLEAA